MTKRTRVVIKYILPVPPPPSAGKQEQAEYQRRLRSIGKSHLEVEAEYARLALDYYTKHMKRWREAVAAAQRAAEPVVAHLAENPNEYPPDFIWDGHGGDDLDEYLTYLKAKVDRALENTRRLARQVEVALEELTKLAGVGELRRGRRRKPDPDQLQPLTERFGYTAAEAEELVNTATGTKRAPGALTRASRRRRAARGDRSK